MILMASGLDLTSAADSRLVLRFLRNNPTDCASWDSRFSGFSMLGPDCRIRPLRRSRDLSRRSSRGLAYVDGRVRDRQTSPSSLSKSSCCEDIPMNPASRASASMRSMAACSTRVGRSSFRVARSNPIVAERMSEWPRKAARFGPSGRASSAAMYSAGLDQVLLSSTAAMTCSRGMASTRPKMSPASVPSR